MSAFGTKRTSYSCRRMSAFEGKADIFSVRSCTDKSEIAECFSYRAFKPLRSFQSRRRSSASRQRAWGLRPALREDRP
jgi:hypothetical protein